MERYSLFVMDDAERRNTRYGRTCAGRADGFVGFAALCLLADSVPACQARDDTAISNDLHKIAMSLIDGPTVEKVWLRQTINEMYALPTEVRTQRPVPVRDRKRYYCG